MNDIFEALARYGYEAGQLKKLPRSGWLLAGVPNGESVAEHSFRVGVLAYALAVLEGANPDRAAALGLFHDMPETRIGDVPSVGKSYVATTDAQQVAADQVSDLPSDLAQHIRGLISEHESAKADDATPEAQCSRDADKLDCLLQAREYAAAGSTTMSRFIETMMRSVSTPSGKALARAAVDVPPASWWDDFAASFGATRGRGE